MRQSPGGVQTLSYLAGRIRLGSGILCGPNLQNLGLQAFDTASNDGDDDLASLLFAGILALLVTARLNLVAAKLDRCFNALLTRFVLIAPTVLVEEIWGDYSHAKRGGEPVSKNLVRCLHHLRDAWIADPLDLAFQELVEEKPIVEIPKPPQYVSESFFTLSPNDAELREWQARTREKKKEFIADRVAQQRANLGTEDFVLLGTPGKLLTDLVWPKLLAILARPLEKTKLLEGVLGQGFRYRHPELGAQIDAAFDRYTPQTVHLYKVSTDCIVTSLVYFYGPLCKVAVPGTQPRKLLKRTREGQFNNLTDQKYVQSALLVASLLTRDDGMRAVMEVFREGGWWNGRILFVEPRRDIESAILDALEHY